MKKDIKVSDAKRYGSRLPFYLEYLEQITGIIKNLIPPNQIEALFENMLPHLRKVFHSDIAFAADEKGKIIKSNQEVALEEERCIPEAVTDLLANSKENFLVLCYTDRHQALKEVKIDSIMALKSQIQGKTVWIGVCNGKNEPEPYLGEDTKFFKHFINLIYSLYEFVLKSEKLSVLNQYNTAHRTGNWSELARTSAELVKKYEDITFLPDFLDAGLCETIFKDSLHQETGMPERGKIIVLDKEKDRFKVQLPEGKEVKELPGVFFINEYKKAALAGARGLLYDTFSGLVGDKGQSTGTACPEVDKYQDWVKVIVKQTAWKNDNDENDFDCKVDWLRTQWLRIYYLARSGSRHPKDSDGQEMRSIYDDTWKKTVTLIQKHLKGNPGKTADTGLITINSDWLLAFLAQNAILSRNLNEHYCLTDSKPNGRNLLTGARFFKHLSRFILYTLHYIRFAKREAEFETKKETLGLHERFIRPPFADVPLTRDSSLSSSIIFMISEYAYREIGIPRELLIFEKLSQQLNFELPLYAANEFYRDHCYHVIDVCLLGEFLLSCDKSNLKSKGKKIIFHELNTDRADTLKNWYIAALCHDLGYVVERVEKLMAPIEKLKTEGLIQFNKSLKDGLKTGKVELKENIDSLCSESDLGLNIELKTQIAGRIDALDHGIIGWLYLCQVLKKLEIPFLSVKPALMAILRHNLSEHDETIHKELLSLLLILCDHLQEWGRPRVATEQLATGVMENMRFSPQESYFDRQVHLNQFSIKGLLLKNPKKEDLPGGICDSCINNNLCKNEGCLRLWPEIQEKGIEFRLEYHGDRTADFEPVLTWLFFCHDFQCRKLPFGQYLFPIAIHFSHPQSTIPLLANEGISELDIFEEFANNNEDAAYLCQWIECARKKKEGIEYKVTDPENDKGKVEEFIIHLESLGLPLARGLHRQQGKDFITWKKKWRTEKLIAGSFGG